MVLRSKLHTTCYAAVLIRASKSLAKLPFDCGNVLCCYICNIYDLEKHLKPIFEDRAVVGAQSDCN